MISILENQETKSISRKSGRYFFVGMSILFPILVALGFIPDYIMISGGELKVPWVLHAHGAIMTGWLVIFMAQSLLIANSNVQRHKQLGQTGFVFGVLVIVSLVGIIARALIVNNAPEPDFQYDILMLQLYLLVSFAGFFTGGMLLRKSPAAHKRLLLLATLVAMQAAVDRIRFLPGLQGAIFIRFLYLDLLLVPVFIYDWMTLRRIHTVTWLGMLLICMMQAGISFNLGSPRWHKFWHNAITPFVERPVEIKLTTAQSDLLIGNYGDTKWHITISREDGKLFYKMPEQPKWELGAVTDTKLFNKTINWKLTFIKGPDGKVTKLINDQIFTVWELKKMP